VEDFADFFLVKIGVRQGRVLSPILFNRVLNWILKDIIDGDGVLIAPGCKVSDLDYADDIALLQSDATKMQLTLDKLAERSARYGLAIKPSKSKVIAIHCPDPVLLIYNEQIETVS